MAEFDLDNPPEEADESPSARRRRERKREGGQEKAKPASDSRAEGALATRLNEAFSKLADQLRAKGDAELADAIADERQGMTHGLVSLTRSVTPLRGPLVFLLELAFVLLAFWRVGGILLRRLLGWRERVIVQQEQEQAAAEYRQAHPDAPPDGPIIPDESVMTN